MKRSKKIEVIDNASSVFPYNLKQIKNPPKVLYCIGDLSLLPSLSIAAVGSRKFSAYGRKMATMIGETVGRSGITVVSGMAYGIDSFSHEGALDAGGKTVAVLGTGIGRAYPARNSGLMERIEDEGLVISEYPEDFKGSKYSFPARNRIISALSEAVVIVEAGANSGALITAGFAAEQGKGLFVVPCNLDDHLGLGGNLLIRDGATPLIVIDDLITHVGGMPVSKNDEGRYSLGVDEKRIMYFVTANQGTSVDTISRELGLAVATAGAMLTIMEVKGALVTYGGRIYPAK